MLQTGGGAGCEELSPENKIRESPQEPPTVAADAVGINNRAAQPTVHHANGHFGCSDQSLKGDNFKVSEK